MNCRVCALRCHVRFPSHLLRSCRHADGCRRMAADCASPDAAAEGRVCRVSSSHSATECLRCRPRTAGDMHAAGPAPLGTCIRWGHARCRPLTVGDMHSLGTCIRLSPAVLARRAFSPPQSPPRGLPSFAIKVPIRFGGRWAAGGRLRDDISRGGGGGAGARATTRRTAGPPPGPRPSGSPPGGARPGCAEPGRRIGHRGVYRAPRSCPPKKFMTTLLSSDLTDRSGPQIEALHAWPRRLS